MVRYIVTHNGYTHRDDFYSCCIALATYGIVPIFRRQPLADELQDPSVMVIDVGLRHQPELHNFDHHQNFSNKITTLSLLLRYLDIDYMLAQIPWYRNFTDFDQKILVMSPIEKSLLNVFSSSKIFEIYNNFVQEMYDIGCRIVSDAIKAYKDSIFSNLKKDKITIYGKEGYVFSSILPPRAKQFIALESEISFAIFNKDDCCFCIITFDELNFRKVHHNKIKKSNNTGTVVYTTDDATLDNVIQLIGFAITSKTTTKER